MDYRRWRIGCRRLRTRYIRAKEQERNNYGTFTKKSRISDELDEWGDENDSGWDDDEYGPSDSFTKAAKRTMKISTFMNRNQTIPDDFVEVLDDLDEEEQNQLNIDERIKNLKTELGEQQKILTVTEYNKKRAIYEYLKRLDENGKGKMKASKEAAQLIFIDCAPNRARSIQYWANFWL
ncbi:hypothetical protein RhiirB3_452466 [Rhizophagus irregularis]|nr:hypothetical protein RhiirB3_452466 [Rhizophagus irregularis]